MPKPIFERYAREVRLGHLERDAAQEDVLVKLDNLSASLTDYRLARKSSALGWLFGNRDAAPSVRGLYIWGSVGRGKTMLMDLFFEVAPVKLKRRVHFHAFMMEVHARVHDWRQKAKVGAVKGDDPIPHVASALAEEAWLLCFDEFAVTDIADAMILGRLFKALFAQGVVIVATSNVPPEELYKDGLNRALFLPFIDLIQDRMEVLRLDARTDFRLEKLSGASVYYVPADAKAHAALTQAFKALTGAEQGTPMKLPVLGRAIPIPEARANVARFTFEQICEMPPLGPTDYVMLAQAFHTLIIDDIPILTPERTNDTKRVIVLVDALYDRHVKLIASAAAEPHELYLGREGTEAFEFQRTVSRLIEMRSVEYLAMPHGSPSSFGSGNTSGLVET